MRLHRLFSSIDIDKQKIMSYNKTNVMQRMLHALKDNGVIYTSFKYGDFEGTRNGRYFTDFTLEAFQEFKKKIPEIVIEEYWISGDVRPGRGEEKWLNLLLRKISF